MGTSKLNSDTRQRYSYNKTRSNDWSERCSFLMCMVSDCFQKWEGLIFHRKFSSFARKYLHMTFCQTQTDNTKFMEFLRVFASRKYFSSTFCRKKGEKTSKVRFFQSFLRKLSKIRRKMFKILAESQTRFQILAGAKPPAPPDR